VPLAKICPVLAEENNAEIENLSAFAAVMLLETARKLYGHENATIVGCEGFLPTTKSQVTARRNTLGICFRTVRLSHTVIQYTPLLKGSLRNQCT